MTAGDDHFVEFVQSRNMALSRLATSLTHDPDSAGDLLQDTYVKVYLRWPTVERTDNPDAYVRTVLVRTFVSSRRLARAREVVDSTLVAAIADAAAAPGADGHRPDLLHELSRLSRKQQAVLVLRYLEDLPDAHIADLLGISEATVRVHAHRGLARLRAALPFTNEQGQ